MIDNNLIPIVAISGAFVAGICITAICCIYAAWKTSSDNALKRDMVARGYTAEEIVAVITAEPGKACDRLLPSVPPAKPIKQPAFGP
jgi:hypothetical protein